MPRSTDLGSNKTGVDLAPLLAQQMERGASEGAPSSAGDEHALNQLRQDYINDAPPVGTTPPPASVKGTAKLATQMLRGRRPSVFMDKLGERLAFERTGTRLYEAIITKYDALGSWDGGPTREQLVAFHDEERKHFETVRQAVEDLGGDPTVMTPAADVVGVLSMGVLQVITDARTSMAEALNALLVAELADNDGWQMLIHLAEGLGQDSLATRFRVALAEEEKHLSAVRRWVTIEADQDVQGGVAAKPPVH
jgi:ferritin-like protein